MHTSHSLSLLSVVLLALLSFTAAGCVHASHPSERPSTLRQRYGLQKPTSLDPARTALLLIDFQEEFFHGGLPLPKGAEAVRHAEQLLAWARAQGIRVIHVQNVASKPGSPLFAPGSPFTELVPSLRPAPGEQLLIKSMAGAFSHTPLAEQLEHQGIQTLIIGGLMTHLAVDTTARDGTVLGYQVIVAADATATRDLPGAVGAEPVSHEVLQRAALASLGDRFAEIMTTEELTALPVQAVAASR